MTTNATDYPIHAGATLNVSTFPEASSASVPTDTNSASLAEIAQVIIFLKMKSSNPFLDNE